MLYAVFEHTAVDGGFAGVRFCRSYTNWDEFQDGFLLKNKRIRLLAKDLPEQVAESKECLTPEICHFTAAIEKICSQDNNFIDLELMSPVLLRTIKKIRNDRTSQEEYAQTPSNEFPFVVIGSDDSKKTKLLRFVRDNFYNPGGRVYNLELSAFKFAVFATLVAHDRDQQ